jgi:hypothetical protein
MKWGIRRYQNTDGSLTAAGRKKARQEYKADNKTAFELGKNATISGRAAARSMKRTIKLENTLDKRYEKDPEGRKMLTKEVRKRWEASAKTTAELASTYTHYKNRAEQHCKSLIDKYGKEAVSSIKYKDMKLPKGKHSPDRFTTMNERTNNLNDYARAGAKSIAATGITTLMGAPFTLVFHPKSTYRKAWELENARYGYNYQQQR